MGTLLMLTSCATRPVSSTMSVNSFAKSDAHELKTYTVAMGPDVTNALEFDEIKAVLIAELAKLGFRVVNGEMPELILDFNYHQKGGAVPMSRSTPVYGQVSPHSVSTANTTTTGPRGASVSTTTVTTPATYGVTGYRTHTDSVVASVILVRIQAIPASFLLEKRTQEELEKIEFPIVWDLDLRYAKVGESLDKRLIIPRMIRAAVPYVGKSSGQIVEVELRD